MTSSSNSFWTELAIDQTIINYIQSRILPRPPKYFFHTIRLNIPGVIPANGKTRIANKENLGLTERGPPKRLIVRVLPVRIFNYSNLYRIFLSKINLLANHEKIDHRLMGYFDMLQVRAIDFSQVFL